MIRTLIEVTAETASEHASQLEDTLDKLGFEPKRSEEYGRFIGLLFEELRERGLDPRKLAEDRAERLAAEREKTK